MTPRNTLLKGIVGSTAYGLAREGSDVDRLGIFAASTLDLAGLDWHPRRESKVHTDPDITFHEVGKYLRLALRCNPTVMELLWLPDELIEFRHQIFGNRLMALKEALLSEQCVRNAYGGYARQQAVKLRDRGDSFSSDTRKRTAKHGRHLLRLLRQGQQLLAEGRLEVKVEDPQDYWDFDDMTPDQMLDIYEREDKTFSMTISVLPDRPDIGKVREFLDLVRDVFMKRK